MQFGISWEKPTVLCDIYDTEAIPQRQISDFQGEKQHGGSLLGTNLSLSTFTFT